MRDVPLVLPLLLVALLPSASSSPALRPRALPPRHEPLDPSFDAGRLRTALRALLELSDAELRALTVASPGLRPSYLLATRKEEATTFDAWTSRRRKKWDEDLQRRGGVPDDPKELSAYLKEEEEEDVQGRDRDSILAALKELSASLKEEEGGGGGGGRGRSRRKRRSHRSHSTLQARGSTQYEAHHHYLYYLRSGECPRSPDGRPKMFCPTPTADGQWICIEEEDLCDGKAQCPGGQDEAPTHCLFHSAMRTHLDELTKFVMLSRLT